MNVSEFVRADEEQIEKLKREFLELLGASNARIHKKPFVIVIGGAPGSGKTTAAESMSYLSGSVHVQSNSARYLLSRHGFEYGKNVHNLVQTVVEEKLSKRWAVTLDGMVTGEEERKLLKDIGDKHGAKVFFIAVRCEPKTLEERAYVRYADGKPSSFDDWRCKPEKFDKYIASITTRAAILETVLWEIPHSLSSGIWPIENNRYKRNLVELVQSTWKSISKKLETARGQ